MSLTVRSRSEEMRTMLGDPIARTHMDAAEAIATAEPHLYKVVSVHHA